MSADIRCDYCDTPATSLAGETNGMLVCVDHVRLFAEREIAAAVDRAESAEAEVERLKDLEDAKSTTLRRMAKPSMEVNISFRVPRALRDAARAKAEEREENISDVLREALERYVKRK